MRAGDFGAPSEDFRVARFIDEASVSWKVVAMKRSFQPEEANVILQIPLGRQHYEDKLIWNFNSCGIYSVKSGYLLARSFYADAHSRNAAQGESSTRGLISSHWQNLWKLEVPRKLLLFLWRCSNEILAVGSMLRSRHLPVDPGCPLCNSDLETPIHLFGACFFARQVWYSSNLQVDS
uniref:Reverse transcriptase zinc-binding domain-containing protein n=1 Tax=Davidia involucrata TaxID=16924 RepID=A0A5B7B467_DAVIN